MINNKELDLLKQALTTLSSGFSDLPEYSTTLDVSRVDATLQALAIKMQDNYPYHHPLYAGQMLKPPHPVARLAYMLSMWVNPNNHALDGGIASSALEKEAVAELGEMMGYTAPLGHLTSGGTMANMEALWVARQLHPGAMIVASEQAHYTHSRISAVLGLKFQSVPVNDRGQMDVDALRSILSGGAVGTVVATLGTTGIGAVDQLDEILALQKEFKFRVHVDSAYGGYFRIANATREAVTRAFAQIQNADSIVIDPHKHGLQPYGCGCILFRDASVGRFYKHESPYTYFSSAELHLGEISLECSRAGAAAAALWATQQLLPLDVSGEFSQMLDQSLAAAQKLYDLVEISDNYQALLQPALDIVVFGVADKSASVVSEKARNIFNRTAEKDLHLALIELPFSLVSPYWPDLTHDRDTVTCLRSCLMKSDHIHWVEEIHSVLEEVA